ncbi:MAG: hypothetical protein OER59_00710 [Desulfobulbaceae bacterium]|nr:hypothetical protein [Desulfobulbaceae bacterium]MDH3775555.1 hypothetical protein [Desulfobulbaceae bacterium]
MVLVELGVEPADGIEPVSLISMVQGFSEIEILQLLRAGRPGRGR